MPTAIMVDGGFFLRRYRILKGHTLDARQVAKDLFTWSLKHLEGKNNELRELYRIFYYDCPPLDKKVFHPLTKELVDIGKSGSGFSGWVPFGVAEAAEGGVAAGATG